MPAPRHKKEGDRESWVRGQEQKELGAGYLAYDEVAGSGGDTAHFTKGHRTRCQGQNQPGRTKSKLLTGPLGREVAVGVLSSPYEEAGKYAGVLPEDQPKVEVLPPNAGAGRPSLEAGTGGWSGPESGGRRSRGKRPGSDSGLCHPVSCVTEENVLNCSGPQVPPL